MNFSSTQADSKTEPRFFIIRGLLLMSLLLLVLVSLTLWGEAHGLDRQFSAQFFTAENGWFLAKSIPWSWLYDYGETPGIIFSILAFIIWYFYRTDPRWSRHRSYFLICALTPFIASLLLVNVVLKDHSGRPRPREIVQFGGSWEYKPALKPGIPGRGHSFPCGHCSIAFTLTSGIVFWRLSRTFALTSLSIGLSYGILMSGARIVQGGHFLSDAVWSLGAVWLTLLALYYFVFQPPRTENSPVSQFSTNQKWKLTFGTAVFLAVLALFIWTRRPFYKDHSVKFPIPREIQQIKVFVPETWKHKPSVFEERENGKFLLEIQGFAPPQTAHYLSFSSESVETTLLLRFNENVVGYQREFKQILALRFPERLKGHISSIPENFILEQQ
ncbi:MAG TPA: phosphatase PAP2 family protein [Candidatus Lambdaproteobacteria bacterium]|nr:phosphatase PAP2 family protein [Candidatus Lambdaproteobacteria bacterium]